MIKKILSILIISTIGIGIFSPMASYANDKELALFYKEMLDNPSKKEFRLLDEDVNYYNNFNWYFLDYPNDYNINWLDGELIITKDNNEKNKFVESFVKEKIKEIKIPKNKTFEKEIEGILHQSMNIKYNKDTKWKRKDVSIHESLYTILFPEYGACQSIVKYWNYIFHNMGYPSYLLVGGLGKDINNITEYHAILAIYDTNNKKWFYIDPNYYVKNLNHVFYMGEIKDGYIPNFFKDLKNLRPLTNNQINEYINIYKKPTNK